MKLAVFIVLLLFLVACSAEKSTSNTSSEKTTVPKSTSTVQTAKSETTNPDAVISCEEVDQGNISIKGKVVFKFANGQKQSVQNYCPEMNYPYVAVVSCFGNTTKERIMKCPGNTTCERGACI